MAPDRHSYHQFVWQQRDGTFHCLYHNGRGKRTNHGLHAFSRDGIVWHKAPDALLPRCAQRNNTLPVSPAVHNCSALYTDVVDLDDGTSIALAGRERPALLFDEVTGAPTWLYNGAIDGNTSVPWYAMVQGVRSH
jgi:sucrose-6-phosphate hydrolase SacC (GH32 family)